MQKCMSYPYKGYIITEGHQWYATKNGKFVFEGATSTELEQRIDDLLS
jgi:hypothetical protein